jgi:ribosomal protein S18 acetylase RimI-like enzyme
MFVRTARLDDLPATYRICHDNGLPADGSGRSPDLLGHVYVGPYLVAPGTRSIVMADDEGVGGYLLCARDTIAFEGWVAAHWLPGLQVDWPLDVARSRADTEIVDLLHHPRPTPPDVAAAYPAHLHIDLHRRLRGRGLGSQLIEELCAELAGEGIPGVHLGVGADNAGAIRLYARLGFTDLGGDDDARLMGRRLTH